MLQKTFSIKILLIALIIILFSGISGALSLSVAGSKIPAEKSFKAAKDNYSQFMANPKDWGQRQRWENLIKEFDSLAQNYSHSKRADDALYLAAGLYSSLYNYSGWSSDLKQSAKRYNKLLQGYKESHLADDALYNLGLISLELNDSEAARAYWQRLLKEYPKSDMRVRTRYKLQETTAVKTVRKSPVPRKKARVKKSQFQKTSGRVSTTRKSPTPKNSTRGKTRVLDLRHWSSPTYTRVVIDLDRETQFTKGILKDKHNSKKTKSIYLNLKDSVIPETRREITINDGILQRVKIAQFNTHTVR
ncbi:MAG: tetratricopeptide repeat protein, partial [Deltaproteobacteria bacterium]|nr:tetratricopeptide repeat protein [Deltaproteobacteria bacterium]